MENRDSKTPAFVLTYNEAVVERMIDADKRFQIAKDILTAIVSGCSAHASYDYEHHCYQAIKYADELINQLKKP